MYVRMLRVAQLKYAHLLFFVVVVEHVVPLHGRARKLSPICIPLSCSHRRPQFSRRRRWQRRWSDEWRNDRRTNAIRAFVCLFRCVQIHALLTTHQHPMTTVINCDAIDFCVHTAFATTTTTKVREGDLIPRFQCDRVYFISFIANPMECFISRLADFVFLLAAYAFFSFSFAALLLLSMLCMILFSPNWWVGLFFVYIVFCFGAAWS